MIGAVVLAKISALRDEGASEDDLASTIFAAIITEAIRRGEAPRQVLDSIWKAFPTDADWDRDDAAARIDAACDDLAEL